MKKGIIVLGLLCLAAVCRAELVQIDFRAYSTGHAVYKGFSAPPIRFGGYGGITGTIRFNPDQLWTNGQFTSDDPYWKWAYETSEQVSLTLNLRNVFTGGGLTFNNTIDFPYGLLESYTQYQQISGWNSNGYHTYDSMTEHFKLTYSDTALLAGIVNTVEVNFNRSYMHFLYDEPFQPMHEFDPEHFAGPYGQRVKDYGRFVRHYVQYSDTGEVEGAYREYFNIVACEMSIVPEPITMLLMGAGGLCIRRRRR